MNLLRWFCSLGSLITVIIALFTSCSPTILTTEGDCIPDQLVHHVAFSKHLPKKNTYSPSPNGRWLAVIDHSHHRIELWDVHKGKKVSSFESQNFFGHLLFHPDSTHLFTITGKKSSKKVTLDLWDFSGKNIRAVDLQMQYIFGVANSRLGNKIAMTDGSVISVRDLVSQARPQRILIPSDTIGGSNSANFIKVSPKGRYVSTRAEQSAPTIWDLRTSSPQKWFSMPEDHSLPQRRAVLFGPEERFVYTSSTKHKVEVWNLEKKSRQQTIPHDSVVAMNYGKSPRILLLGKEDGSIAFWDLLLQKTIKILPAGWKETEQACQNKSDCLSAKCVNNRCLKRADELGHSSPIEYLIWNAKQKTLLSVTAKNFRLWRCR